MLISNIINCDVLVSDVVGGHWGKLAQVDVVRVSEVVRLCHCGVSPFEHINVDRLVGYVLDDVSFGYVGVVVPMPVVSPCGVPFAKWLS